MAIAEWLVEQLNENIPTLVGIDHSFSFPAHYFEHMNCYENWDAFLLDFATHWPTDGDQIFVDLFRDGMDLPSVRADRRHTLAAPYGSPERFRQIRLSLSTSRALSRNHRTQAFPWLRFVRTNTTGKVHFWPFDGWDLPAGRSALVEIYPALCRAFRPHGEYTMDQADAYSAARWMQETDRTGMLPMYLSPVLNGTNVSWQNTKGGSLGYDEF